MRSVLRPLIAIIASAVIASCFLCILFPTDGGAAGSEDRLERRSEVRAASGWFSFGDPTSLFSPSATITLTDDNSTFFNAKPAAFGPLLPLEGLSGQLWVGTGFGDDSMSRRGIAAMVEGELGCADIPGWTDRSWKHWKESEAARAQSRGDVRRRKHGVQINSGRKRDSERTEDTSPLINSDSRENSDGTDDTLHRPLPNTSIRKLEDRDSSIIAAARSPAHADIQSLQEAAEIDGKIVLLSRGGCGFSEKIMWAQRRGAVAVIVANSVRGGPLVRMYARDEVSNITIPSLFTSHTTAHLLSHLIPIIQEEEEGKEEEAAVRVIGRDGILQPQAEEQAKLSTNTAFAASNNKVAAPSLSLSAHRLGIIAADDAEHLAPAVRPSSEHSIKDPEYTLTHETSTPLSPRDVSLNQGHVSSVEPMTSREPTYQHTDGFVIGVQDWRDPDVVEMKALPRSSMTTKSSPPIVKPPLRVGLRHGVLKGGIITPSSGEYEPAVEEERRFDFVTPIVFSWGWLKRLLPQRIAYTPGKHSTGVPVQARQRAPGDFPANVPRNANGFEVGVQEHRGLWITLTPTDLNASPFLNTLFVLVISPLITLAIVYSLLLARSRFRRRRWRAPKAVVERLPVRIYHAFSNRTSPIPKTPSIAPSECTMTTPLLSTPELSNPSAEPISHGSAPLETSLATSSSSQYGSLDRSVMEREKDTCGLAEWKRKYGGKQKECVVCLEEYVDGVSRVMSLPCGHDFHASCITPWLTTRRRTCPICKGDVVRSVDAAQLHTSTAEVHNSPTTPGPIQSQASTSMIDVERLEHRSALSSLDQTIPPSSSWLSRNVYRRMDYFGLRDEDHNGHNPSSDGPPQR